MIGLFGVVGEPTADFGIIPHVLRGPAVCGKNPGHYFHELLVSGVLRAGVLHEKYKSTGNFSTFYCFRLVLFTLGNLDSTPVAPWILSWLRFFRFLRQFSHCTSAIAAVFALHQCHIFEETHLAARTFFTVHACTIALVIVLVLLGSR